jgi:NAD-dependent deacetylase
MSDENNKWTNTELEKLKQAAELILRSEHTTVFTGAGISIESGIPPFRGKDGLWGKFDPQLLDISFFERNPLESWKFIKEIFFDNFGNTLPNKAHEILALWEISGLVHAVITQNIDGLHQKAGSREVYEFHGNLRKLICTKCSKVHPATNEKLLELPPLCNVCGALLKPDFVFFGEPIPEPANTMSHTEIDKADLFLVIGTTGEIMPASSIPVLFSQRGKKVIEINIAPSNYTGNITDIFLQGKATEVLSELMRVIKLK